LRSHTEKTSVPEMRDWGERRLATLEQVFGSMIILEVTE